MNNTLLPELTKEQVIARGGSARALLSDPTFNSFIEETKTLTLVAIGNTQPNDQDERETLYLRYNAINDLLGTMQSYVIAADELLSETTTNEIN